MLTNCDVERQTDRQADRQKERQTDRQTNVAFSPSGMGYTTM